MPFRPSEHSADRAAFAAKREAAARERQRLADGLRERARERRGEHLRVLSDLDVEETLYPHMSRRRASR